MAAPSGNRKSKPAAKAKAPRRKGGGSGSGSGPGGGLAWFLVAAVAAGLLWIAWPIFFPPPSGAPMKRAEAVRQAETISAQNPEAEVFHPDGDSLKKK